MDVLFLIFMLVLTAGISWWNAYAVGRSWAEAKAAGGFIYLVNWAGAIMSALGFSMILFIGIGFLVSVTGYMPPEGIELFQSFYQLMMIPPLLGSGYIIMFYSWMVAWRERSLLNIGVAGWNTYANISNTIAAFDIIPDALGGIGSALKEGDSPQAKLVIVAFLLAVIALVGGALIATKLIQYYRDKPYELPASVREHAST